jgi:hypothetical protein
MMSKTLLKQMKYIFRYGKEIIYFQTTVPIFFFHEEGEIQTIKGKGQGKSDP